MSLSIIYLQLSGNFIFLLKLIYRSPVLLIVIFRKLGFSLTKISLSSSSIKIWIGSGILSLKNRVTRTPAKVEFFWLLTISSENYDGFLDSFWTFYISSISKISSNCMAVSFLVSFRMGNGVSSSATLITYKISFPSSIGSVTTIPYIDLPNALTLI